MLRSTRFTSTIFIVVVVVVVVVLVTIVIALPDILEPGLGGQLTSRSIKRSRHGNWKCMPVHHLAQARS
jgi:sensor histidine kinase regulating citrate/malate metabolism